MKMLMSGNLASSGYLFCKSLREKGIEADLVYQRVSDIIEGTQEDWIKTYRLPSNNSDTKEQVGGNSKTERPKRSEFNLTQKITNRIQYLSLPGINLEQYDLFQLNYLKNKLNIGIVLRHRLKDWKKPILVYVQSSYTIKIKTGYQGLINRFITHRAKLILCGSPRQLQHIRHFPKEKRVIPNPIDTSRFRKISSEIYNDRILCWVKLEKIKGVDVIFNTAKLLPNYQFDIPDVGIDAEYYTKIKPKNVNLISRVPHISAPNIINKYPLILGQFVIGGYGSSELEAMACCKPIIAYLDFDYGDFYNDRCPILSSRDPKQISELIKDHIGDKDLGKSSRKWVENFHSTDKVSDKLIEIYNEVLEQ